MKIKMISLAIAGILLAALAWMSALPEVAGYTGIMLIRRPFETSGGISPATAQSLRGEGLLLTYEIPSAATAEVVNSRHQIRLIGTNSSYLDVTGHRLVSGGFFPHTVWERELRQATLNEAAAARIFGSVNINERTIIIDGHTWIITGVVDDGDDETLNIYAPSSVTGGHARSLMIVTQGGSAGWSYAASILAGFGIHEGEYDFTDLSRAANAGAERFSLSWKIALALAIVLLGAKGFFLIKATCASFARDLDSQYPREIAARRKADITKEVVAAAFLAVVAAALMNLSLRILVTAISWREVFLPRLYPGADFAGITAWLQNYHTFGIWVFGGYIAAVFTIAIQGITRRKKHGSDLP